MIITLESCKGLSDNEIVARSLENLDYFSCLYQRYEPELLRYIRRMSRVDEEEEQDILQIPPGTAAIRINRAKKIIRDQSGSE